MKTRKNKKGDIPVTILVLGVVMVCVLAILSFIFFGPNLTKGFAYVGGVEEVAFDMEQISFYEKIGLSDLEIREKVEVHNEKGEEFLFWEKKEGDKSLFSVKYFLSSPVE